MISPISRLALFVLANAVLMNALLFIGSGFEYRATPAYRLSAGVWGLPGLDSWRPMRSALEHLQAHPDEDLYFGILDENRGKFQYPPSALAAYTAMNATRGLLRLPDNEVSLRLVTGAVGGIFVVLCAWFAGLILFSGMKAAGGRLEGGGGRWDRPVLWATAAVSTLTFYPVIRAYELGQIQVWINAMLAVLVWFWMTDRKTGAGVLTGLICLIKPHYGLLLLWGALRRQWSFLASGAATLAIGLAGSLWAFGPKSHLDYPSYLSFMSSRGEAYYPNQSINGLLNRIWSIRSPELYPNLRWFPNYFLPFNPAVFYPTVISSAVLILAALFLVRNRSARGKSLDLGIMVLSVTMASPIAWEHHYGVLLPIYASLVPGVLADPAHPRALVGLGVSYVLTGHYLGVVNSLAHTPLNFAQSYLLAGALLLLVLCYRLQGRGGPVRETRQAVGESS